MWNLRQSRIDSGIAFVNIATTSRERTRAQEAIVDIDADALIVNAVRDAIREGIKAKFQQSYQNPFDPLLTACLKRHEASLAGLIGEAIGLAVCDPAFRQEVAAAVRASLAKTLVQRFGGELEKQVNQLKSDPATRARITLAIAEIVKEKTAQ
jgi:hypothetical protein